MATNNKKVQNAPKQTQVASKVDANQLALKSIMELETQLQNAIASYLQNGGSKKELTKAKRKAKLDAIKADPKLYAEFKAARKDARIKRIEELKKDPSAYNKFLTKKNERAKIRRDRVKKALQLLKEQEEQAKNKKAS